jgi:ABC-2 type transport system ATP-binding protein
MTNMPQAITKHPVKEDYADDSRKCVVPAICCEDLCLRYRKQPQAALSGLSLEIPEGSICGILGRNGAGKTSFLSLLAAYRKPTSGRVKVFGAAPYENPDVVPKITFAYSCDADSLGIFGAMSVQEVLKLSALFRPDWDGEYAGSMIERFELSGKKTVMSLSKGQQAALQCVVGLASRSPLTIFDEVYNGMDAVYRRVFRDALLKDYVAHPRTILFSTHYISEWESIFSEAVIIDQGRLVLHEDSDRLRSGNAASLHDLFIQLTRKEGEGNVFEA